MENHENHFAMVENYVEKYQPIRQLSMVSKVMQSLYVNQGPRNKRFDPYAQYMKLEHEMLTKLHQEVLKDDGIACLHNQMKEIKFNVETLLNKDYQAPKQETINRMGIKEQMTKVQEGDQKPPPESLQRINKTKLYRKFTKQLTKSKGTTKKETELAGKSSERLKETPDVV